MCADWTHLVKPGVVLISYLFQDNLAFEFLPSSGVTVHMLRHLHAQYCPVRWLETKSPPLMLSKNAKSTKTVTIYNGPF